MRPVHSKAQEKRNRANVLHPYPPTRRLCQPHRRPFNGWWTLGSGATRPGSPNLADSLFLKSLDDLDEEEDKDEDDDEVEDLDDDEEDEDEDEDDLDEDVDEDDEDDDEDDDEEEEEDEEGGVKPLKM